MTNISLIASSLNVRAVDLYGKTSAALLQILVNEIAKFDEDVLNASSLNANESIIEFLHTHKCDLLPSASIELEWDEWLASKDNILSLLCWVLSNSELLTKRCYIAPFLVPTDVPAEYLFDNNLQDLLEEYRGLQHDFVQTHKEYESLKGSTISELESRCKQMGREKKQLLSRCDQVMTDSNPKFQQLLLLTSNLRKEQARALTLKHQLTEQKSSWDLVAKILRDVTKISDILSSNQDSIDDCTANLENEKGSSLQNLEMQLIPKRLELEAIASKDDAAANAEDNLDYTDEDDSSSSKLIAMKKVYLAENERLRDALEKNDAEKKSLKLESSLQEKIKLHEQEQNEISAAQQHLIELECVKEELAARLQAAENELREEEEKSEITGFRDIHKQLGNTFKGMCKLNEMKSDTLQELGDIVKNIAAIIEEKKEILEPMIAKLKEDRAIFQSVRDKHAEYKEHELKLAGENKSLEDRFLQMQKECEERESLYALLTTTDPIVTASTLEQKLAEVGSFQAASNLNQLYKDKISQLLQLRDELGSKDDDNKKGGRDYILKQQAMFDNLKKLLEMKTRSLL